MPDTDYLDLSDGTIKTFENEWLLRYVNEPVHPHVDASGKLAADILTKPQTDHIAKRMSVSLFGLFQGSDIAWRPIKGISNSDEVHKEWKPGDAGRMPTASEYQYEVGVGYWRIPIKHLNGKEIKIDDITYSCSIKHQPTVCNYWHFELHVCDPSGNHLIGKDNDEDKQFQKLRKKVAKLILPTLIEQAKSEVPPPAPVNYPEDMYKQSIGTSVEEEKEDISTAILETSSEPKALKET
ncbi:hypothetical protein [Hymenobacter chitinivorans]|uniref:hypothetical protein n=1 Tax=Hymenobacter chitinivorans TaxID=89969 RepID=UPI0012FDC63F|nr:hypothetical protein [Hymenobacter chitinivorans]